jgi:hypothetical protein
MHVDKMKILVYQDKMKIVVFLRSTLQIFLSMKSTPYKLKLYMLVQKNQIKLRVILKQLNQRQKSVSYLNYF